MNTNNNLLVNPESPKIASAVVDKIKKAKDTVIVWVKWVNEGVKYEYNSSKRNSAENKLESDGYTIYEKTERRDYLLCKKTVKSTYPKIVEFAVYDLKKSKLLKFENGMLAKQYIEKEENGDDVMQSDNVETEFNK